MLRFSEINLPNKLTLLRILATPPIVFFMLWGGKISPLITLILFAAASVTDYFDGKIARSRHIVTDFGKFLDPIADKIIVISILICMIPSGLCPPVAVVILIFREFTVSSLRLVAASKNVVLAAAKSGKVKTASQMVAITVILALLCVCSFTDIDLPVETVSAVLIWITAAAAVYSGAEYLFRNKAFIDPFE